MTALDYMEKHIRVHHRRGERSSARDRDRVDMVHKPCGVKK